GSRSAVAVEGGDGAAGRAIAGVTARGCWHPSLPAGASAMGGVATQAALSAERCRGRTSPCLKTRRSGNHWLWLTKDSNGRYKIRLSRPNRPRPGKRGPPCRVTFGQERRDTQELSGPAASRCQRGHGELVAEFCPKRSGGANIRDGVSGRGGKGIWQPL